MMMMMMDGVNNVKHPASSYTIWIITSVWRRKTSLLAILILTLVLLICVQYNVTKEIAEITLSHQEQSVADTEVNEPSVLRASNGKNHIRNVQFIGEDGGNLPTNENFVDILSKNNNNNNVAIAMEYAKPLNMIDFPRKKSIDSGYKRLAKIPYIPNHRIVHLDLKGAPPKVSYLRKFFSLIKELGATGILIEWEDMFPWEYNLKNLAAKNAYTRQETMEILSIAKKFDLEIIPLVQTFGHVEFALKNEEFVNLREVPESPQALCPSLNASFEFVLDMIHQIMKVHRDVNFLHIGCDEVFHLGECSRCRKKLRDELFLSYVSQLAKYIRKRYPYTVPIIWDDMLRHLPISTLEMYNIGKLVEPMVWVYAEDVYRFVPQIVWEKYQTIFPSAWTASAFKGAFGETFYIPNVKRHLENNLNWLSLMSVEESRFAKGFRGIAITGWQRYDHFATLCEMLPASVPSLAVNLVVVSRGYANNSLKETLFRGLNCGTVSGNFMNGPYMRDVETQSSFLNLDNDPFLWDQFSRCTFIGSQFYRTLFRWHSLEKEINDFLYLIKSRKAWLTSYNVQRNFSSPLRIDELMMDESRIYHNLISMVQSINDALKEVFDKYTIAEWIEQKIYPLVIQMEKMQKVTQKLKTIRIWPRRPLPPLKDLQRIGVTVVASNGTTNDDQSPNKK